MKTKQLSEWNLIEFLNWADNNKDTAALTARCIAKVGRAGWQALNMFVGEKVWELQTTIKAYEEGMGSLDIGSDDGFSDVCYHIVGLGKEEFDKCIQNPKLVEKRYNAPYGTYEGYRESFAYMFHEPEPERTPEDTKNDLEEMLVQVGKIIKRILTVSNSLETAYQDLSKLADSVVVVKKDLEKQ